MEWSFVRYGMHRQNLISRFCFTLAGRHGWEVSFLHKFGGKLVTLGCASQRFAALAPIPGPSVNRGAIYCQTTSTLLSTSTERHTASQKFRRLQANGCKLTSTQQAYCRCCYVYMHTTDAATSGSTIAS